MWDCDSSKCCFGPKIRVPIWWLELVGQNGEKVKVVIEKDNAYVTIILMKSGEKYGFTNFCYNQVNVWIDEKANVVQAPIVGYVGKP
ncbi:hypothetical protein BT93_L2376 [Corymbia citriodora subsp. variegata]|uniref:Uncharacterized protein n=1 Tax=Corymbia citriodora subsp. variegata TaxID=360336 RepID=A0A8T0CQ58_CORYI|nr:hypothetical protein BT93_L2376 [Corymbia citriodora subsp. variegata]